jgi:hypothetical protein
LESIYEFEYKNKKYKIKYKKEEYDFETLKQEYNSKKLGCGSWLGKVYIPGHIEFKDLPKIDKKQHNKKIVKFADGSTGYNVNFQTLKLLDPESYSEYIPDKIKDIRCKSWVCKPCRNINKNNLHQNILREVYRLGLTNHMVITFPGLYDRLIFGFKKSYKMVNNDFNKLVKCMRRQYNKLKSGKKSNYKNNLFHNNEIPEDELAYIYLPRAQTQPKDNNPIGFCHLHVILNWKINVHWVEECIDRNGYELGFCFIRENQSVADYLCKDFFEDDEFIIPKKIRHYNCSRNVKINVSDGFTITDGSRTLLNLNKVENKNTLIEVLEDQLKNNYTNYEIFGKKLKVEDPKILPFEEYLKQFVDLQPSAAKEVYDYGSLKRYNHYTKKRNDFTARAGGNK